MSLGVQRPPVKVLRWSATTWRRMEATRDRIMFGYGTDEPWYLDEDWLESGERYTVQWRKPLSVSEVNQMAPTPEVLQRPGRA